MLRNYWFIGIQLIIVGGQILIIFVGGQAFSVERSNGAEWGCSLVLGALSILVAIVIRLIPDEALQRFAPLIQRHRNSSLQVLVEDEERITEWNPALEEIREELNFLKRIRGGRMSALAYKLQHPRETLLPRSRRASMHSEVTLPRTPTAEHNGTELSPASSQTPESKVRRERRGRSRSNSSFGPAAAMAGIIAGSVAGGWSPVVRGRDDTDSIKFSTSKPHGGLDATRGIEVHPDTRDDDPVIVESPQRSHVPPSQIPDLTPVFSHGPLTQSSSSKRSGRSHSRQS